MVSVVNTSPLSYVHVFYKVKNGLRAQLARVPLRGLLVRGWGDSRPPFFPLSGEKGGAAPGGTCARGQPRGQPAWQGGRSAM